MTSAKGIKAIIVVIIATCLISSSLAIFFVSNLYSKEQFRLLSGISRNMIESNPGLEQQILSNLKEFVDSGEAAVNDGIFLTNYGYQEKDFLFDAQEKLSFAAVKIFVIGGIFLICAFLLFRRQYQIRINELTQYLEKVNTNSSGTIIHTTEDSFSHLQDEIYKTITTLYQTKDAALSAKSNFADNLTNIAHQLKTPITAASISVQLLERTNTSEYTQQIKRQLSRLSTLEEALLLLSQIDAGTLVLEKTTIDIFTVLNLAVDNIATLLHTADVSIDIADNDCIEMLGDLDWTMEALINLIKNCVEHSPKGSAVHCDYSVNTLYTEILIWDEGKGFVSEDIPHLFERFYRGSKTAGTGIGVGLSLSQAIFEMENGYITAQNRAEGGACFEVRIYSH